MKKPASVSKITVSVLGLTLISIPSFAATKCMLGQKCDLTFPYPS